MNKVKPLSLRETTLKEEMKSRCLQKGQYIDENAKEKFDMLCHLEDFELQYFELLSQVEKLTGENNDLEERIIHQDNVIKKLKQPQIFIDTEDMEERYGEELYKEYLEKEKEHLQSVIEELEKWIKCMQEVSNLDLNCLNATLDKLNELRGKE